MLSNKSGEAEQPKLLLRKGKGKGKFSFSIHPKSFSLIGEEREFMGLTKQYRVLFSEVKAGQLDNSREDEARVIDKSNFWSLDFWSLGLIIKVELGSIFDRTIFDLLLL